MEISVYVVRVPAFLRPDTGATGRQVSYTSSTPESRQGPFAPIFVLGAEIHFGPR